MLGRTKATVDINERLRKLATNGIEMHTQVVLCPGWNDGPHLERTVTDLSAYYPAVRSVALVPVGLTDHRHQLAQLDPVTPAKATEYVRRRRSVGLAIQSAFWRAVRLSGGRDLSVDGSASTRGFVLRCVSPARKRHRHGLLLSRHLGRG